MAQINKQQLKDYFRRGNKPTESQFEDLIDSNINLKDSKITIDTDQNIGLDVDNPIAKLHVNGTLQLEGKTDYTGAKGTLRWTGTDLVVKTENEDESASWRSLVSQSGEITVDGDVIGIGLVGQSLSSRLHLSGPVLIDNTTKHTNEAMLNVMGSVGIGTNQPESNLHIAATYNQSLSGTVSGVQNDYNANLTGTVDGTMGNTTLTGTGTSFTSELAVHQKIRIDGGTYTISSITDDTTLVLNENLISEVSGQPVSVCELTGTGTIFDIEIATGQQIQIGTNVYTILEVISATCIRLDKALLQDATNATVYIIGDLLKVQDIDEATVLTIDKEGNVGIGTTPSAGVKLEVDGNTTLDGTLDVTGDTSVSTLDSTGTTSLATDGGAVDIASSGATTTVKGTLNVDEAVTLDTTLDVTGATTLSNTLTVSGTGDSSFIGNVGIGTTPSTGAKLEVNGVLKVNGAITSPEGTLRDDGGGWIRTYGNTGWCSQTHGGGWHMTDSIWIRSFNNKSIYHNSGIMRTDGMFQVGGSGSRFLVKTDGNVGIGTTDPKAKLEVSGTSSKTLNSYSWLGNNTTRAITSINKRRDSATFLGDYVADFTWTDVHMAATGRRSTPYTGPYSIYASGRIACSELNVHCDERIKEIKSVSDANEDLNTLLQIQVTDYSYKDPVIHGNQLQKKVLGQQIAKVYPQAVTYKQNEVVPDIMKHAIADGHGAIQLKNHGLSINDKVQILYQEDDKDKQEIFVIKEVEEDCFKVDFSASGEVFIYGREVDDFHVVDIDALSMLNISATQALASKVKKTDVLQQEVDALKEENMLLNDRLNAIEEKLGLI